MKTYGILCYQNELNAVTARLEAQGFDDYEVGDKMLGVKLIHVKAQESDAVQLGKISKSTLWATQKDFE